MSEAAAVLAWLKEPGRFSRAVVEADYGPVLIANGYDSRTHVMGQLALAGTSWHQLALAGTNRHRHQAQVQHLGHLG